MPFEIYAEWSQICWNTKPSHQKDIIAKGVGMSSSGNVKVDSVTISSAEKLSAQEMLYVLLKNNGVEGESKLRFDGVLGIAIPC